MIDPVVTQRIEEAIRCGRRVEFGAPLREGEQRLYYRELAWLGYTATQVVNATGWNVNRIQRDLRELHERRKAYAHDATAADALEVEIVHHPGAVVIRTPDASIAIDGHHRELAHFGRLVFSAATNQQESA